MTETVLTSRRAALLTPSGPVAGRLRVSDRAVVFAAPGADPVRVALVEVQRVALRRRTVVIRTEEAEVRLRCFGVRGVAVLLTVLLTRSAASGGAERHFA